MGASQAAHTPSMLRCACSALQGYHLPQRSACVHTQSHTPPRPPRRAGIRPGWVSVLHLARQVKAAPQSEEPERYLFWGGAGQFVDLLARVSTPGGEQQGCTSWWAPPRAQRRPAPQLGLTPRCPPHGACAHRALPTAALALQDVLALGGTIVCAAPVRHITQCEDAGVSVVSDAGT